MKAQKPYVITCAKTYQCMSAHKQVTYILYAVWVTNVTHTVPGCLSPAYEGNLSS